VQIGTIVGSSSHISYLCRVFGHLEAPEVPQPDAYAFGTFVTLDPEAPQGPRLVGIISDTVLVNPEFGNLGPRLSSGSELAVFSPDYLNETGVLAEIHVVGWLDDLPHQAIPPTVAQVGTVVDTMLPEEVVSFHASPDGRFVMAYMPQFLARGDPMLASLALTVLEALQPAYPADAGVIEVLKTNLIWKSQIIPAG